MNTGERIVIDSIIKVLPAVALRGMTILPDTIIHFDLKRQKSVVAVERAMMEEQQLFLVTQLNADDEDPDYEQLHKIGTIATIKQVTKLPGNVVRVLVESTGRAKFTALYDENKEYLEAEIEEIEGTPIEDKLQEEAMLREVKELFAEYAKFFPKIGTNMRQRFQDIEDLGHLMDQLVMNLPVEYKEKQRILEAVDLTERYESVTKLLQSETEIIRIKTDLAQKIKGRVDKSQKEYLLREQMNYIREELGEDTSFSDIDRFEEAVKKLKADKSVKEKIEKEIARFKSLGGSNSESAVERAYIETLLEMPWNKKSKDNQNIADAKEVLEADHYGLEKVKERILESLAVRCLNGKGESPILCLVGPPGTGKTSIARSVATALGKKYVRICLGGVRDEAEIRGHRKTYVGAMPGRIANGLKQAGVKNPLMLLDEIDKVSNDYKGDTFSALLEVLDSEQNVRFRDHYIELPIDLSEVLFIATANTTETIPRPLLDRMELIEVTSYTANEKFHIAKEHLVGKQLEKNGLNREILSISDGALKNIIAYYTKEAGVRGLERKIGEICRKCARELLVQIQGKEKKQGKVLGESTNRFENMETIKVGTGNLEKYLGKPRYSLDKANTLDEAGIVRGLAWTSVGGDTLQIEVNVMPGKGEIDLTGQMGDVMKESAKIGISYVRSISKEYHLPADTFKKNDFHIHIPEGAVPKDGPSAGITMATALLSAITGIPVKAEVAMTGEITLRGKVLPIGGLKEKILAAKMAGIKTVLVPGENRKDIDEIDEEIKSGLKIHYVETMKDVLKYAFVEQ